MKKILLMSIVVACSLYARNPISAAGEAVSGVVDSVGNAANTQVKGSVKQSSNVKVGNVKLSGDRNTVAMGNNGVKRGTKINGSLTQKSHVKVGSAKVTGDDNNLHLGNNGI